MNGPELLAIADQLYFEPVEAYRIETTFDAVLRRLLPADWSIKRHQLWLAADPAHRDIPLQGFKIHVSTTPGTAVDTIERVIPECVAREVSFKVVADGLLLSVMNSKRAARGSSGKFITIYPRSHAGFLELIARLDEVTRGLDGPHILSDRRYRDNRVLYYRYGGFLLIPKLRPDGSTTPTIQGADGAAIDDERKAFFALPPGIDDPFPDETPPGADLRIGGRFTVTEALTFSNAGGVYRATDGESGRAVILKEARPFTHIWHDSTGSLDAVALLGREYALLQSLADTPYFPQPVALVTEWEHTFLAEELVEGIPLTRFRARDENILTANLDDPIGVAEICGRMVRVVGAVLDAVDTLHARGLVLGDVSPNNVLVEPDTLRIRLIDLESVCPEGASDTFGRFAVSWHTPGYRPRRAAGASAAPTFADDYYGVGMLLHSLILPVEPFFNLWPAAADRFLERFVDAGLPAGMRDAVRCLMANDPDGAREALSRC